jgi:hypothetical protein
VSFAAITLCVASQRVFIVVRVYFVTTQSGNFWIHNYTCCRYEMWREYSSGPCVSVGHVLQRFAFKHRQNFNAISVGIALGNGLDDRGFESRLGLGIFLFTTASRTALRPTQPPIQWVPGALSLVVKRPVREADHSPPSSAEVNK